MSSITTLMETASMETNVARKILKEKWEEFRKGAFPPALDELDVKPDLVELDSYIAGTILSYLTGERVEIPLEIDQEVERKLKTFKPKTEHDKRYYPQYIEYKSKLDELGIKL